MSGEIILTSFLGILSLTNHHIYLFNWLLIYLWPLVSVSYHDLPQYFPQCPKAAFGFHCLWSHQGISLRFYPLAHWFDTAKQILVWSGFACFGEKTPPSLSFCRCLVHSLESPIEHWDEDRLSSVVFHGKWLSNSGQRSNILVVTFSHRMGFSGGSTGKEPTCNEGDQGYIPVLGRSTILQHNDFFKKKNSWHGCVVGGRGEGHLLLFISFSSGPKAERKRLICHSLPGPMGPRAQRTLLKALFGIKYLPGPSHMYSL